MRRALTLATVFPSAKAVFPPMAPQSGENSKVPSPTGSPSQKNQKGRSHPALMLGDVLLLPVDPAHIPGMAGDVVVPDLGEGFDRGDTVVKHKHFSCSNVGFFAAARWRRLQGRVKSR